jgi:hypothetical protein
MVLFFRRGLVFVYFLYWRVTLVRFVGRGLLWYFFLEGGLFWYIFDFGGAGSQKCKKWGGAEGRKWSNGGDNPGNFS